MSNSGVSLATVLFLIFLVLKLVGTIDWSWWWVMAPLWSGFVIAGVVVVLMLAVETTCGLMDAFSVWRTRRIMRRIDEE